MYVYNLDTPFLQNSHYMSLPKMGEDKTKHVSS